MKNKRIEQLLGSAMGQGTYRIVGQYTEPRSYGVYDVRDAGRSRRYRFGNHPVRELELLREFDSVSVVGIFRNREEAMELAGLLNWK